LSNKITDKRLASTGGSVQHCDAVSGAVLGQYILHRFHLCWSNLVGPTGQFNRGHPVPLDISYTGTLRQCSESPARCVQANRAHKYKVAYRAAIRQGYHYPWRLHRFGCTWNSGLAEGQCASGGSFHVWPHAHSWGSVRGWRFLMHLCPHAPGAQSASLH